MLTWFDADPVRFWTLAWGLFTLLALAALGPAIGGVYSERWEQRCLQRVPPWLFVALSGLGLIAFRWPLWFVGHELNVDESHMIAEAITLQYDPVFWRSVDGSTHGPLAIYPLWLARLLGLKLDYVGARVIGLAMVWLVIFFCYRALAVLAREHLARVTVLPVFCFFAFSTFGDFVHYSSEHVPLVLLTLGFWLISAELAHPVTRTAHSLRWLFAGVILGAVPMAKLQGVPVTVGLLVTVALLDFLLPGISWQGRFKRLLLLAAGAAAPTGFFATITWLSGTWDHAWISYITQNLHYATARHFSHREMVETFWSYVGKSGNLFSFLAGCVTVGGIALFSSLSASGAALRFAGCALVFLVSSIAAALAPGRQFFHYLLFLVPAAGVMAGSLWLNSWEVARHFARPRASRIFLLVLLCAAAVYPQISALVARPHPYVGILTGFKPLASDAVAAEILNYADSDEPLGIWGWGCRYFVSTQMPQATRDAHTAAQIIQSPLTDYYRARYLRDFVRKRPPVFVDTVGPNDPSFKDRATQAHEVFEQFRVHIAAHYMQVAELDGSRIYVRLDRVPQR